MGLGPFCCIAHSWIPFLTALMRNLEDCLALRLVVRHGQRGSDLPGADRLRGGPEFDWGDVIIWYLLGVGLKRTRGKPGILQGRLWRIPEFVDTRVCNSAPGFALFRETKSRLCSAVSR